MRVVEISGAFGLDHLKTVDRPPHGEPGPAEVLVEMQAASLNYRDLLVVEGLYNPRQRLPLVPCSDGVGTVVSVGSEVKEFAPGDRVMTCFAQGWIDDPFPPNFRDITLGSPRDGTLTESMLLSASGVVGVPDYLSDREAAALPCAALTAWSAIVELGQVDADDVVVVQGTGGVALAAVQFAASLDARVIVTSKSDSKLRRARDLGAAETINYVETPDWSRRVKELTDGAGADHVIELGGSATLRQTVRAVRSGGFVSMIGVLGGSVAEIDLPLVVMRNVRLQGVTVGSRGALKRMLAFMDAQRIRPVVDSVFSLHQAPDAFRHLKSGAHFGKICVSIAS